MTSMNKKDAECPGETERDSARLEASSFNQFYWLEGTKAGSGAPEFWQHVESDTQSTLSTPKTSQ